MRQKTIRLIFELRIAPNPFILFNNSLRDQWIGSVTDVCELNVSIDHDIHFEQLSAKVVRHDRPLQPLVQSA